MCVLGGRGSINGSYLVSARHAVTSYTTLTQACAQALQKTRVNVITLLDDEDIQHTALLDQVVVCSVVLHYVPA